LVIRLQRAPAFVFPVHWVLLVVLMVGVVVDFVDVDLILNELHCAFGLHTEQAV
jgi:hypothetical protein